MKKYNDCIHVEGVCSAQVSLLPVMTMSMLCLSSLKYDSDGIVTTSPTQVL